MTNVNAILDSLITEADIGAAAAAGACAEALAWARAEARTWRDAPPEWRGWFAENVAERRGDTARADALKGHQ